jgi:two-component system phosphate regulon sensor histidine kinase PhoR
MFFGKQKKYIAGLRQELESLSCKISELEKRNLANQGILKSMVEGVIMVDRQAKIVFANPSAKKIFDIKEDLEGKLFLEAIRNNDLFGLINDIFGSGKLVSRELNLVWPVQKNFQVNALPVMEENKVSGCLLVIHDITEMRRLETVRSDFVANVSHELKTPLTSIKGFLETLLEGAIDDKEHSRNFLEIIQGHASRLDALVSDLLDLSYLESEAKNIAKEKVKLRDLADEVLTGFKAQLKKKAILVKNDLPADLSLSVDRQRIGQVFTNLIDNAIKFNQQSGSIMIYSQELEGKVKIIIEDTGIGIPPKDISRIFERFYRVDKARSRALGGTGLGLSIVKHIVELHAGSVGVESTEGLGSKFWFSLPKRF